MRGTGIKAGGYTLLKIAAVSFAPAISFLMVLYWNDGTFIVQNIVVITLHKLVDSMVVDAALPYVSPHEVVPIKSCFT